jgi:hypothetical protein
MASVELEGASSVAVQQAEVDGGGGGGGGGEGGGGLKGNKKKTKKAPWKLGFACLRTEYDREGNFDMEVVDGAGERRTPTHLVVMVNGLIGR